MLGAMWGYENIRDPILINKELQIEYNRSIYSQLHHSGAKIVLKCSKSHEGKKKEAINF